MYSRCFLREDGLLHERIHYTSDMRAVMIKKHETIVECTYPTAVNKDLILPRDQWPLGEPTQETR